MGWVKGQPINTEQPLNIITTLCGYVKNTDNSEKKARLCTRMTGRHRNKSGRGGGGGRESAWFTYTFLIFSTVLTMLLYYHF